MTSPFSLHFVAPHSPAECGGGAAAALDRLSPVAALNDAFRQDFRRGRLVLTHGTASLPAGKLQHLLREVQRFAAFTPENDPHGEHDFGKIAVEGDSYFWKIDCFDLDMRHGSPNPANALITARVITVMGSDEY